MKSAVKDSFTSIYQEEIKKERAASPNFKLIDAEDVKIGDLEKDIEGFQKEKTSDPQIKKLKDDIERVKTGSGFDVDKAEDIRKINDQIATVVAQIDTKIATANTNIQASKKAKKAVEDNLTKREQNIVFAVKALKSSLDNNATFGAPETPTPAPTPHP